MTRKTRKTPRGFPVRWRYVALRYREEIAGLKLELRELSERHARLIHYARLHTEFVRRDDLLNERLRTFDQYGRPL